MKKSVIAVLVIGIMSVAGTAFAYRGQGSTSQGFVRRGCPAFENRQAWQASRGADFAHHSQFFNEMPQEICDREVEADKLHLDLGNVLSKKPLDREKALELRGKIDKLRQDVRAWRFAQKLNRIEEFKKRLRSILAVSRDNSYFNTNMLASGLEINPGLMIFNCHVIPSII